MLSHFGIVVGKANMDVNKTFSMSFLCVRKLNEIDLENDIHGIDAKNLCEKISSDLQSQFEFRAF